METKQLRLPIFWVEELEKLNKEAVEQKGFFEYLLDRNSEGHTQEDLLENRGFFKDVDTQHMCEELKAVIGELEKVVAITSKFSALRERVVVELQQRDTKNGMLYVKYNGLGRYDLLDSEKRWLFWNFTSEEIEETIKHINEAESVGKWLENEEYEDVCWGSKQDIIDFATDYHESNGRKVSMKYIEENYNHIGNTYVLFEYSNADL